MQSGIAAISAVIQYKIEAQYRVACLHPSEDVLHCTVRARVPLLRADEHVLVHGHHQEADVKVPLHDEPHAGAFHFPVNQHCLRWLQPSCKGCLAQG